MWVVFVYLSLWEWKANVVFFIQFALGVRTGRNHHASLDGCGSECGDRKQIVSIGRLAARRHSKANIYARLACKFAGWKQNRILVTQIIYFEFFACKLQNDKQTKKRERRSFIRFHHRTRKCSDDFPSAECPSPIVWDCFPERFSVASSVSYR